MPRRVLKGLLLYLKNNKSSSDFISRNIITFTDKVISHIFCNKLPYNRYNFLLSLQN